MKICLIGAKSFPEITGGIETHVYEIATRLAKKGNDVTVIVSQNKNKQKEKIQGVTVYRVPFKAFKILDKIPFAQSRFSVKGTMMPRVIMQAKKTKADVYHAHDAVM
ncbi:MAG: glycosyltransferase, partial [Candidatus Diapherotrites archaeon]|nr:glycosyltransferase [Candidatus Diapherotrites archaeon]